MNTFIISSRRFRFLLRSMSAQGNNIAQSCAAEVEYVQIISRIFLFRSPSNEIQGQNFQQKRSSIIWKLWALEEVS